MAQGNRQEGERVTLFFTSDSSSFETTRNTLMRQEQSLFAKLLRGEVSDVRGVRINDQHGHGLIMEIDRSGTVFRHVLHYLEKGYIPNNPGNNQGLDEDLEDLYSDADFFQLSGLLEIVKGGQGRRYFNKLRPWNR